MDVSKISQLTIKFKYFCDSKILIYLITKIKYLQVLNKTQEETL